MWRTPEEGPSNLSLGSPGSGPSRPPTCAGSRGEQQAAVGEEQLQAVLTQPQQVLLEASSLSHSRWWWKHGCIRQAAPAGRAGGKARPCQPCARSPGAPRRSGPRLTTPLTFLGTEGGKGRVPSPESPPSDTRTALTSTGRACTCFVAGWPSPVLLDHRGRLPLPAGGRKVTSRPMAREAGGEQRHGR